MNQDTNKLLDEARLLMPWYLSGRLSKDEQAIVNQALETYPELQQECAQEEKMMCTVRANTSLLELAALDTTEQRLSKLLTRIERSEAGASDTIASNNTAKTELGSDLKLARPSVKLSRLTQWWQKFWNPENAGWPRPAGAVFAALLVAQVAVLAYYTQTETTYRLVNLSPQEASMVDKERVLLSKEPFWVIFKPDAPVASLQTFLIQHEASIVSGPHGNGMYLVAMPVATSVDKVTLADDLESRAKATDNNPIEFFGATNWDSVFSAE